jgi:D-beta-D-heptose 7-phosphate kinase/D-beta-D-heptose 1-phosphate adenosyltransferase
MHRQPGSIRKLFELESLCRARGRWRHQGRTVVFTNGCFDLLHGGHVHLLNTARKQGDTLIVAVNDDSLSCVDALISFPDDTPLRLITEILPDVLVKGGDWKLEEVVGRSEVEAAGGRVVIVPYLAGHSSSRIIERISRLAGLSSSK